MSLDFSSATGALFTILGKLGTIIKSASANQVVQQTNLIDTSLGVVAQLNNESDLQGIVGNGYIGALNAIGQIGSLCQNVASATVNRKVFRDNPRPGQTLQSTNTLECLREIIRQMKVQGASILAMPITLTPGTFSPGMGGSAGDVVINSSARRPLDGLVLENAFSESVLFTCKNDSYAGSAAAFNESFSFASPGSQQNPFAFNWPLASGCSGNISVIDGDSDNTAGNLLNNSGFSDWTSNVPDQWALEVGVAGTNIVQESTLIFSTGSAVKLVGDGSTKTAISQTFGLSTGTSTSLTPLRQYGVNLFVRRDGVSPAAGVLTVELVDSSGAIINDQGGTANSFTVDLTALTTNYASYKGSFRTPLVLPTSYKIRIRMSTALTNLRSVYLDKLSVGLMTQLYTSGPYASLHAGAVPSKSLDYGSLVIVNGRGSGGTFNTFQTLCYRLFPSDVLNNELLLPSSVSPTIVDSVFIL